jgi:hypothetical protein
VRSVTATCSGSGSTGSLIAGSATSETQLSRLDALNRARIRRMRRRDVGGSDNQNLSPVDTAPAALREPLRG